MPSYVYLFFSCLILFICSGRAFVKLHFSRAKSPISIEMSTSGVEAILYDVDGTLSDSFLLGFKATDEVLKAEGFPSISEETYHDGTIYTTPRRFAWHATGNPDDDTGIGVKLGRLFDEYYVNLVSLETAPLYAGMDMMLRSFATQGIKQGALSNACGAYVQAVVDVNGIRDIFRVVKGADEVPEAKPGGGGLLQCSEIIGVEPSKCIYVGDSPTDGHAATAAGYYCSIGVTWGSHPPERVRPAFTYTVSSVEELRTLLNGLISGDNLV